MFKANASSERVNYSSIMVPPSGYILEKAIGTTYSLDFETLTAIAISAGLRDEADSKILDNPVILLNAIKRVSDRILIFCEDGQIKIPHKQTPLLILLEKMINPVRLAKVEGRKGYPSFHPKTWTISFVNNAGDRIYRFGVLSRNLAFSRDWDVAFYLDGKENDSNLDKTKPIIDFIEYLKGQISKDGKDSSRKKDFIDDLIIKLNEVSFELDSKEFKDFQVLPIGIGAKAVDMKKDTLFNESFHEVVIMSPFISNSTINTFNRANRILTDCRRALFTRKSELEKLMKESVAGFKIYTLKDQVVNGETILSDDDDVKLNQDIHAKIFMLRKDSNVSLYLGSMNATHSAINSNVELDIRLFTRKTKLDYERLTSDFFCGPEDDSGNPFELSQITESKSTSETVEDLLEQQLKDLCRCSKRAFISEVDGSYQMRIEWENIYPEYDAYISPLCVNNEKKLENEVTYAGLSLVQLTEFLKIKVVIGDAKLERVIMIEVINMPSSRETEVVNNIIETKRQFIEYVAYILDDEYLLTLFQKQQMDKSGIFNQAPDLLPALYEKMLKTSLESPDKMSELDYIVRMIKKNDVIPTEFLETYDAFKQVLKI